MIPVILGDSREIDGHCDKGLKIGYRGIKDAEFGRDRGVLYDLTFFFIISLVVIDPEPKNRYPGLRVETSGPE